MKIITACSEIVQNTKIHTARAEDDVSISEPGGTYCTYCTYCSYCTYCTYCYRQDLKSYLEQMEKLPVNLTL